MSERRIVNLRAFFGLPDQEGDAGVRCSQCGAMTRVIASWSVKDGTRKRHRLCIRCGKDDFNTREVRE